MEMPEFTEVLMAVVILIGYSIYRLVTIIVSLLALKEIWLCTNIPLRYGIYFILRFFLALVQLPIHLFLTLGCFNQFVQINGSRDIYRSVQTLIKSKDHFNQMLATCNIALICMISYSAFIMYKLSSYPNISVLIRLEKYSFILWSYVLLVRLIAGWLDRYNLFYDFIK